MELIEVEVAYADSTPVVVRLLVAPGTTLGEAIAQSGVRCDLARCGVGVYGKARGLDEPVAVGDRIEIYRPLTQDPKERRRRAAR